MSVSIAETPTFEQRAVHFDRGRVFAKVICLVHIFTSKAISYSVNATLTLNSKGCLDHEDRFTDSCVSL